jgi:hypothetical protein
MLMFSRLRTTKKATTLDEKKAGPSQTNPKPEGPKPYKHVPRPAGPDGPKVSIPAKAHQLNQIRDQHRSRSKLTPSRAGPVRSVDSETKPGSQAQDAGDFSMASVLEQPLQTSQSRRSSRHSSFNSSNRRPPFARRSSSLIRTRSQLVKTIVGMFDSELHLDHC